ncbi:DoxX family protein [Burkholderia cepacia]|uniref:DoxX family protein n=1 Tax=Burkholderia cepacia TaxID=292 RepID=A0A2S8I9F7_BURCE|nr:DoxX family protein [Burkholderia cepacia]PQP11416.1 DoxX family protein [Burkholderia cepacia]HDR9511003.1 DoxX family protein [Burkholderia cepacia]
MPLTLLRIAIGSFFFASGFTKLVVPANQAAMLETLTQAGIPFPQWMAPIVSGFEVLAGVLLTIGFASRLGALILATISLTALVTVGTRAIPPHLGAIAWYSWLLYLPEMLYLLVCFLICVQGSGPWSIDARLCRRGAQLARPEY